MSQQQETRTFTQEQANAMYAALQRMAALDANYGASIHYEISAILQETLQALATPQAEPASQPATGLRYVVETIEGTIFIRDTETNIIPVISFVDKTQAQQLVNALNNGQRYFANGADVYEVGKFIKMHSYYDTDHEAQTEADRLNADSTGQGGE